MIILICSKEGDKRGKQGMKFSKCISGSVICTPNQIVIGAGTQQIMSQLLYYTYKKGIKHVAVEEPGYLPVRNIFRDRDFGITPVSVGKDGILISRLPANIKSAVYVSPSNQFPTGSVMPIGKGMNFLTGHLPTRASYLKMIMTANLDILGNQYLHFKDLITMKE